MTFTVEIEGEGDGRWLAEMPAFRRHDPWPEPGRSRRVRALALRVIAERLEHREVPAEFLNVTFQAA